jgi:hypothetical protein
VWGCRREVAGRNDLHIDAEVGRGTLWRWARTCHSASAEGEIFRWVWCALGHLARSVRLQLFKNQVVAESAVLVGCFDSVAEFPKASFCPGFDELGPGGEWWVPLEGDWGPCGAGTPWQLCRVDGRRGAAALLSSDHF